MEITGSINTPVSLPIIKVGVDQRTAENKEAYLKETGLEPPVSESNISDERSLSSSGDVRQLSLNQASALDSEDAETSQNASQDDLTPEEEEQVAKLKQRDAEVRAHEQAHLAAAGSLATGGIQYQYQTGPDGKQYAIGGSVQLDTSKEKSPEATIQKAQQIRRAALAPADPSPQDVKVASQALQMEAEARREINEEPQDSEGSDDASVVNAVTISQLQAAYEEGLSIR